MVDFSYSQEVHFHQFSGPNSQFWNLRFSIFSDGKFSSSIFDFSVEFFFRPEKWFTVFSATIRDEKATDGSFESSLNSPDMIFLRFLIFATGGARARENQFLAPKFRYPISLQPWGFRGWEMTHSKALMILRILAKNNFRNFCSWREKRQKLFFATIMSLSENLKIENLKIWKSENLKIWKSKN